MPLSKTLLKTEIKAAIVAEFAADGVDITDAASVAWDRIAKAIADSVIQHFTTNALVSTTGTAAAQTGVIS